MEQLRSPRRLLQEELAPHDCAGFGFDNLRSPGPRVRLEGEGGSGLTRDVDKQCGKPWHL